MLFNKITGKIVGLCDEDPLGDQEFVCISYRPLRNGEKHYFATWWEDILKNCIIVCPD